MPSLALGIPVSLLLALLGLRVLQRARLRGGVPDRMVGVFFVCLGSGAIPALLASDASVFSAEQAPLAMAFGHAVLSVGFAALYIFAWKCFGPNSAWRHVLATTGIGVLALMWVVQGLSEQFAAPGGPVVRATALVRALVLAWAFGESLHYRLMMQRRVRLGIADPVVANRFLLWCFWTGGLLGAIGVVIAVRFFVGSLDELGAALELAVRLCVTGFASGAAVSLWLAFFPPPAYVVRLRSPAA